MVMWLFPEQDFYSPRARLAMKKARLCAGLF
jgi:hypothetical protein